MDLLLRRERSTNRSTPGVLYVNGERECYTLEDLVREIPYRPIAQWKIQNKTAIPAGKYKVVLDISARWQRVMPHIIDLPEQNLLNEREAPLGGFSGIRIHMGNTDADTSGCILVAHNRLTFDRIYNCEAAYRPLFKKLQAAIGNGEQVTLTIVNAVELPATEVV